jgi:transglutaminase-like putative cysteine protease
VSVDPRLVQHEDAFGNITHAFQADGPLDELRVLVEGEVETHDSQGVVRGTIERFPAGLFLRETPLTAPSDEIRALAAELRVGFAADDLGFLHALNARLPDDIAFDTDPTHAATSAAEAYALRRGVCQDMAHVFLAAARAAGVPARYVSGYFHRADGVVEQEAGHAWAEAHVPDLGWVAFDPANRVCATEAHVRVAVGLDYLSAARVRGTRTGGSHETLAVKLQVAHAARQAQN